MSKGHIRERLSPCAVPVPKKDGPTEVENRTPSTRLGTLVKSNIKSWEECPSPVELAYNHAKHSALLFSPFEIVYDYNPQSPLHLNSLPLSVECSFDGEEKAEQVRKIHARAKEDIEEKTKQCEKHANKDREELVFEWRPPWIHLRKNRLGREEPVFEWRPPWIHLRKNRLGREEPVFEWRPPWDHLRKDRFPAERKSKLLPRAEGPSEVIKEINYNAYQMDFQGKYDISPSFNVSDLLPYVADSDLRTNPLQEGGDDMIAVSKETEAAGEPEIAEGSLVPELRRWPRKRIHSSPEDRITYLGCKSSLLSRRRLHPVMMTK